MKALLLPVFSSAILLMIFRGSFVPGVRHAEKVV